MNIFIICSRSLLQLAAPHEHLERLEREGHMVHAPWRDTSQEVGRTALDVCRDNADAIAAADEVHVFWDGASQGALLDMGAAIALRKPLVNCWNPGRVPWGLLGITLMAMY